MDPALLEVARCPRCGEKLRAARGQQSECTGCGTSFPELGGLSPGIPVLLTEPTRTLSEWQREVQRFSELVAHGRSTMDEQLQRADLLPSTRVRLERTRTAHTRNGERLVELLTSAGLGADSRAKASDREFSLIEYYEQILRDWAWDGGQHRENAEAAELVLSALGEEKSLGKMLVLGAGPCRLSYDLHTRLKPELTVALDLNPLLLLAARQVIFGGGIDLAEFPPEPRDLASTVVEHQLRAPAGTPTGFHFVLADAFAPPLARGSFDTVLTPWFIDIVPADIRESISLVHGLLAPGGRWVHYGPLAYPKDHPHAQRYSREELDELIALADFEPPSPRPPRTLALGYMNSPASSRAKTVDVMSFTARKRRQQSAPVVELPPGDAPPPWLVMSHLPIPRFEGLATYRPDHPLLEYLVGLLDGQRTLADLAARMVKDHGARPEAALTGTRAMLALVVGKVKEASS